MALCWLKDGGADHLAEAEPDGIVEHFEYFALIEQARQAFSAPRLGRWGGGDVAVRSVRGARHCTCRLSVPVFVSNGRRKVRFLSFAKGTRSGDCPKFPAPVPGVVLALLVAGQFDGTICSTEHFQERC